MEENKLYLSQSQLKDYENMCPVAFSKKWFGTPEERELMQLAESSAIRWGIFFETLVVGSGVNGKTIELTDKENKSVYYERVVKQAKLCRDYLKAIGGKIIGVQQYLQASFEYEGATYYIQGNLDIVWEFKDGRRAVIDLKSTGDADNDFGPFQWNDVERIDVTQLVQYKHLHNIHYGLDCETYFLVFDISKNERFKPFDVKISEWTMEDHKARIAKAYNEISESLLLDYWEPKNTFHNCKSCPLNDTCQFRNKFPEFIVVEK